MRAVALPSLWRLEAVEACEDPMITVPLTNRIDVHLDGHRFTHTHHGPKVWPWWKLVVFHLARWNGAGVNIYKGYNVWVYTRWGAWCHGISWPKVTS
jgi:hypothetical protein